MTSFLRFARCSGAYEEFTQFLGIDRQKTEGALEHPRFVFTLFVKRVEYITPDTLHVDAYAFPVGQKHLRVA